MTYNELISFSLKFHPSILLAATLAYYKYGDRSDILVKSHQGNGQTLKTLRSRLANNLSEKIKPIFQNSPVNASPIIKPDGSNFSYIERPGNPTESEAYKDAVRNFFEEYSDEALIYIKMYSSSDLWNIFTKWLTRLIISLLIWEAFCSALFHFENIYPLGLNEKFPILAFWITILLCGGIILSLVPIEIYHSRMIEIRKKYDL